MVVLYKNKHMNKYIFLLIFLFLSYFSNAQFVVSVKSNFNQDTVKTCEDRDITFYAFGIYNGDTLDSLHYKWDFDDGNFQSDINLDTITYNYVTAAAYRVMVTVWNDTLRGYNILPVELGLDPWFTDTKADIPDDQDGICKGESVSLLGDVKLHKWKEKRQNVRTEIYPQYIDATHSYSSYITRRSFDVDSVFSSSLNIDSIGIKLEHSNTSNIKITLTCPTQKTVVLKDSGGVEKIFGNPVTASGDFSEGTGYWYYFTNHPVNGKMNTFSGADTLPSGTYQSDSLLSKLIGCPLNGDWTISVTDYGDDADDGYVFAWSLFFSDEVEADTLTYNNLYDLNSASWSGDGMNLTSNGVGEAVPDTYGAHEYHFLIKDNFTCYHDTALSIIVEKPEIDADKIDMEIGDSVKLDDQTSWAKQWDWEFGDESDVLHDKSVYKKYLDSATYAIILTAYSESGCKDYDTVNIRVYPRSPLQVTENNVFTPNGDGLNDVFTFFTTPDEKITAANIASVHGGVYNRYGELVCRWNDPEKLLKGWDGTKNNDGVRNVPAGFYYYSFIIKGKDGIKYEPIYGTVYVYRTRK